MSHSPAQPRSSVRVTKVLTASFLSPSDAERVVAEQAVIKWNFSVLKDV